MRTRLLDLLRCPACSGTLQSVSFASSEGEEVVEGLLVCSCGASYPVVNTIPRMLRNAYELFPSFAKRYADRPEVARGAAAAARPQGRAPVEVKTQRSFGYQWTTFSEMSCDFEENF